MPVARKAVLRTLVLTTVIVGLAVPTVAQATHSLDLRTNGSATLISPTQVRVNGTLTCVDAPEAGAVGVVLIQPLGGVALNGGGSAPFSCSTGETVSWAVVVNANEFSTFTKGRAQFDSFAQTNCSDEEVDCPNAGNEGIIKIKGSAGGLRIDPARLRFGAQSFGSFVKQTITLTNTSSMTLFVSIETLNVPDDFSPGQPESTCFLEGVGVNELAPGAGCTEVVAFQPDPFFDQPETATLLVTARDTVGSVIATRTVKVTGKGV